MGGEPLRMTLEAKRLNVSDHLAKARDLERLALRMPGVRGAKVEADPHGITAVRLLIVPERDAESTTFQVRELAAARLGIQLDASVIHVLRTTTGSAPARVQRRKLTSLTTERAEEMFRARVTLELPGDVLVGESQTPPGELFELRAVAKAVLEGISDLLDFPVEVELVELIRHAGRDVVMVGLHRETEKLVGTAVVRHDELDAVARATLDALNRFLGINLDRQLSAS